MTFEVLRKHLKKAFSTKYHEGTKDKEKLKFPKQI
jgi:hypothetical protein